MSYIKQNFTDGQTLTAAHLNHMEEGIAAAEQTGGSSGTVSGIGLTPEQFGAVGDGVTDDNDALQAAFNAASEQKKPLSLSPEKNYLFKKGLDVKSDLHVIGNGATLTCELASGQAITGWGERGNHLKNLVLEDFRLIAADDDASSYMLVLARCTDVVLRGLTFFSDICDCNRCCMDLFGANQNVLVENCTFYQQSACREGGIWVRNWSNDASDDSEQTRNVKILNSTFYKAGGDEVLAVWGWSGNVKDVLISGCHFYEVDDQKYIERGFWPAWFITLGQTRKSATGLGITDVRMENCFIRTKRCETIFRMLNSGTHAVVDNCDIYMEQPDDIPEHDPNRSACAMLAQGNGDPFGTVFTNNRIHFRGDNGRKIAYLVGAFRNNYFDVELGNGPASSSEVVGNVFKGKFARQIFNDCGTIRDNIIEAEVSAPGLFSGASIAADNHYILTVNGNNQGGAVFKNNWGSGIIRNNRVEMTCVTEEPYTIKKYDFPMKNSVPEYIDGNIVTITGDVEYDSPHLPSVLRGTVYRKNNFFNNVKERLFECTGVTFGSDSITEQYKKNTSLSVTISPEGCTDPVIYKWSDPDGVLETEDETYRPMKDGTASVTVTCGMYEATQTIKVELVPVACESIRLSRIKALCGVGQTTYLKAFITPYWATDEVTWASDAEDVATVTQDGAVSLLKTGSANITVTCGSQTASCALTVVETDQLPTYTNGALVLDGTVAYIPLPNLAKEHTLYLSFEVDASSVDPGEELPLISNLLSGQNGQEAVRVAFGADGNGYRTIRWSTTDVDTGEDGNTSCYSVPFVNNGFKAQDIASTSFLYLKDGVANNNGTVVWSPVISTVKPAPDSGYLSLNVQTNASDQPVNNYATGAALQAALTSGAVHATKAKGFKLHELILFANSSYTNVDDIKMYREGAEIDLRFDADGNPVNAGTAGDIVIAGKGNTEIIPVSSVTLDNSTLAMTTGSTSTLTATVLPVDATDKTVHWTVSPEGIASLSAATGNTVTLSAAKAGNCTITATAGGQSAQCSVTVTAADTGDPSDPVPVFSLPETEFTPEKATVVDTGIKLFESADGAKDYTIIISQRPHSTITTGTINKYCLLHCMEETEPWPGLSVSGGASAYGISAFSKREGSMLASGIGFESINTYVFAIRVSGKRVWAKAYRANSAQWIESKGWLDITDYAAVSKSLLIGGYQESDGTKGRFWDGTVYFCKIYDKLLTEEQINKIMES